MTETAVIRIGPKHDADELRGYSSRRRRVSYAFEPKRGERVDCYCAPELMGGHIFIDQLFLVEPPGQALESGADALADRLRATLTRYGMAPTLVEADSDENGAGDVIAEEDWYSIVIRILPDGQLAYSAFANLDSGVLEARRQRGLARSDDQLDFLAFWLAGVRAA